MKKIYVAEDDPAIAGMLGNFLRLQEEYEVSIFSDGLKLYQKLQEARPDLLILDIILPSLSGLAITRLVKFHREYRKIPALIISSMTEKNIHRRVIQEIGADAFLTKPFDIDELGALVSGLLARKSH